jgi:hypothetical protein
VPGEDGGGCKAKTLRCKLPLLVETDAAAAGSLDG